MSAALNQSPASAAGRGGASRKRLSNEQFIEKATSVHGEKYSYSLVNYKNTQTSVEIICAKHGVFLQKPHNHLRGNGCSKCTKIGYSKQSKKREVRVFSKESFVSVAQSIHGGKYDYCSVIYKAVHVKVTIICPEHGSFEQTPNNHLLSGGCIHCGHNKMRKKADVFFAQCATLHSDKYSYAKAIYTSALTRIRIICPVHGEFKQKAGEHAKGHGCEKCARQAGSIWGATNWAARQGSRKALLYIVRLHRGEEAFYKVGITLRSVSYRLGRGKVPYDVELIALFGSDDAVIIHKTESDIKKRFKLMRHHPAQRFAGYTECYTDAAEIISFLMTKEDIKRID